MSRQLRDLQQELFTALDSPTRESDRLPGVAFANAVRPLRWSSRAVTLYVHTIANLAERGLPSGVPSVCVDMEAWVHSSYKTLTPATKTLIDELNAAERPLLMLLRTLPSPVSSTPDPLRRYEGPRERALARKIAALQGQLFNTLKGVTPVETGLPRTLGIETQAEAEANEHPAKGSTEIGHGRTAAGSTYTIWLEPVRSGSSSLAGHCQLHVAVSEGESSRSGSGVIEISSGGSGEACLSRRHPLSPSVQCDNYQGVLTIEVQTLPGTRTARLVLSDGREITSSVALVPASLGGPVGFYYQVVRGPSPIPVALKELDRHGRVLRTVKLPRTERCAKHRPETTSEIRSIVRGNLSHGGSFTITGERITGEYVKGGFHLRIEVAPEEALGFGSLFATEEGGSGRPSSPFNRQLKTGCQPQEYAIVYGVLKKRADTVLVRSAGVLEALHRARIPARLHLGPVLAYIALPAVPSELLVRTPSGKIVTRENLSRRARDARETCEGEAEG